MPALFVMICYSSELISERKESGERKESLIEKWEALLCDHVETTPTSKVRHLYSIVCALCLSIVQVTKLIKRGISTSQRGEVWKWMLRAQKVSDRLLGDNFDYKVSS